MMDGRDPLDLLLREIDSLALKVVGACAAVLFVLWALERWT